jgi:isopropylmalate/homocitrate/citramalate synthase
MFCNGKRDQRKITIFFDRFHSLNSEQKVLADEDLEKLLSTCMEHLHEKYSSDVS